MKKLFFYKTLAILLFLLPTLLLLSCQGKEGKPPNIHVWESYDIVLHTSENYDNPYTEVECGVVLAGPDFEKKIHGFWNGDKEFIVRITATHPGEWTWESFSNQDDDGLNNKSGILTAISWTDEELMENPNRKGFLRPTSNQHGLQYANGDPFFMLGDTWWAASTWRYPLNGSELDNGYIPAEGISLEQALHFRKQQGYNTIAMIAAFPNWAADEYPAQYMNDDGIGVRQAWEKNGINTAKDMHDDEGNMPFEVWAEKKVIANYDRINPDYFKNLDRKINYMNEQGFVIFLETVRRDHGPSWKHYFDFKESYARYVQYIFSRYGTNNIIFSGIHLDWINDDYCLPAQEFNDVLTYHLEKYGSPPFGQPHTILIDGSTYTQFGHGEEAPWLTMHSVGNVPRNHGFYPMIEELFSLESPYPVANLEPYYPGWDNEYHNTVAGERPVPDSDRDHYFARAQMYGSVLSGGLVGHLYGTGAYCGSTTGEPRNEGERPSIWEGLNYISGAQMQYLGDFITSEGAAYLDCTPARKLLLPHKAAGAPEGGLDGWSFMLLSSNQDLGFLYFEKDSEIPKIKGLKKNTAYSLHWFNPRNGEWMENYHTMESDFNGELDLNSFPNGLKIGDSDWCLKLTETN